MNPYRTTRWQLISNSGWNIENLCIVLLKYTYLCFVRSSQSTKTILLHTIKLITFLVEVNCIPCELRIAHIYYGLNGVCIHLVQGLTEGKRKRRNKGLSSICPHRKIVGIMKTNKKVATCTETCKWYKILWPKHWRWRDEGISEKIILKWILSSPLLECDLDLLGSGLEPVAGYCEQCQAHSVPQKQSLSWEAKWLLASHEGLRSMELLFKHVNTFAASHLNTQGLNNSCLKSPASTLVDLTFQSRALRSFSLNQLRNLSL